LFICSLGFKGNAQTSTYHPFLDSSASWNYTYQAVCWAPPMNTLYYHHLTIQIGNDTSINSTTYHTFQIPAIVVNAGTSCLVPGNYVLPGKYGGAFRNDHPNKKVYYVPEGDSVEQLMYDFNLNVGDSLKGYLFPCDSGFSYCDTVISMDSVLVGNSYRKKWFVDQPYFVDLIEGIGSTYGLIEQVYPGFADLYDISLKCFRQNNQTLYPDTLNTCVVLTSLENISTFNEDIIIYPNPSSGNINIDISKAPSLVSWQLWNLNGQLILQEKTTTESKIETGPLQPGVYLLQATLKDGRKLYKKCVVL